MRRKFVVLGTSRFTVALAKAIVDSNAELSAIVTLPQSLLPDNSEDIHAAAAQLGCRSLEIADINAPESVRLLKELEADYVMSSWPKILKAEALSVPRRYVIGTHPTELPANRGRHPLHWLIVLGFARTKLSFFRMDTGIDTGNILHTVPFEIDERDTVADLVGKMNDAGYRGACELVKQLDENETFDGREQSSAEANYWRARTPHDVTLDFRMTARDLQRLARSFAPPYPCAKLFFEQDVVPISSVLDANTDLTDDQVRRLETGRVVSASERSIVVKAADRLVDCCSSEALPLGLRRAKHIFPPTYYVAKWGVESFFSK